MKKYKYFCFYHWEHKGRAGVGNIELVADEPISTLDKVREFEDKISQGNGMERIFIVNMQLFPIGIQPSWFSRVATWFGNFIASVES